MSRRAGEQGSVEPREQELNFSPAPLPSCPAAMLKWSRDDWLALAVLAFLVLLFHWPLITPNLSDRQSYPPGDFSHQFWAFSTFEVRELSAGRLPLWNPYAFAGSPFWADVQSAVLYPFSLLTITLSGLTGQGFSLFALELEAIFHFWLAGSFMFLLARRVTQNRAAGVVAALIFAFGGYLTGYPSQQLAVLEVDVWLPLILFFIDRALLQRQPDESPISRRKLHLPDLLLAGAAWGMAILAGHPQSWLITAYTFIAYFLFLIIFHASRFMLYVSRFTSLLLIILTGLALSAIQLLPAVEYTRLSVRAEGFYDEMSGGFPLIDPIQFLLPDIVSYYSPLYVGVMGLLLAILALFYGRNCFIGFWGLWGGLAFLISFGGSTFLYVPLYLIVPGFAIFRGQERWAFVVAFSLALLAGYGMQVLCDHRQMTIHSQSPMAAGLSSFERLVRWLLVGSIGLVVIFFYGLNDRGWSTESQFYSLLNTAVLLLVLMSLNLIVFRVVIKSKPPQNLILIGTGAVILFDLFTVNWQNNLYPQLPDWHTQEPAIVAALEADLAETDELFRVYNEFRLYDNYGLPFKLQDLWGASPLRISHYDRFVAPPMLIERAWAMLNVKYVITWRSELYVPSTVLYQEPAPDGMTYLHRLEEVGPRAWVVHEVIRIPETAMLAAMAEPDFDYRQVALLPPTASLPHLQPGEGDFVQVTSFAPNRLVLQVKAGADGLLVLSEIDYPGWRATVDDAPVPILRANYALRSIPIPAGTHEVVFTFAPMTFQVGAALSGLTSLGLVLALGYWGWQVRRQRMND